MVPALFVGGFTALILVLRCPLLTQSGHYAMSDLCPLSGVKRTSQYERLTSARRRCSRVAARGARAAAGDAGRLGVLRNTSLAPFQSLVTAFGRGLKEAGFVEGQNVAIEYRYAGNHTERLPALVTELLGLPGTGHRGVWRPKGQ